MAGLFWPDSTGAQALTNLRREPIRGDAVALHFHESARLRAAALHARRTYPGPLGELVSRELTAYADFGYRLSNDGLIPRLATAVLATRAEG